MKTIPLWLVRIAARLDFYFAKWHGETLIMPDKESFDRLWRKS